MKYALKTVNSDMTARGGFVWPESGEVVAPDWKDSPVCGNGLHALLWGVGDSTLLSWEEDARWLVLEIADGTPIVDLSGKVKFPECRVIHCGTQYTATQLLVALGVRGPIVGVNLTVTSDACAVGGDRSILVGGDRSTLTGGERSTLTGGYRSVLTGGYRSTLTGGDLSILIGGYRSTLTGGDLSVLTGGNRSVLTGGDRSVLTGGDRSTLTGGYRSVLTGGDLSVLTGGDRSVLTGRDRSTLTGGERSILIGGDRSVLIGGDKSVLTGGSESTLIFSYPACGVFLNFVATVGKDGCDPGVAYECKDGKLVVSGA